MKRLLYILFLFLVSINGVAQENWTWTKIASLPITTTDNAVSEAFVDNQKFVYSFGGITDSLTYDNIHQRVFKYDISQDVWSTTDTIPDTLGKIGSAASFVNNRIYLIGGNHVDNNNNETSSNKVHIYNPETDSFEADGTPMAVPVDNHVQAVWNDSLIYVISGWSNSANVPNIQIYNPYLNSWSIGSSTPNTNEYRAFGASGYILEDTIYYFGGVSETPNFETNSYLRKGVINPEDPTTIDWSIVIHNNGSSIYKSACSGHGKTIFWIGGSQEGHDFNTISYATNQQVEPNNRIVELNLKEKTFSDIYTLETKVMNLNGIAKLGGGNWILTGGVDTLQHATSDTYLLHNPELSDIDKAQIPPFFEVQNSGDYFKVKTENIGQITVYDIQGRALFESQKQLADLKIHKSDLHTGMLIFVYNNNINLPLVIKKINP